MRLWWRYSLCGGIRVTPSEKVVRRPARAGAPRIGPLAESEWDDSVRELLAPRAASGPVLNIFSTLARHPKLFTPWMGFAGKLLLTGTLPARDRELLILRTGWNCGSEYEWGQHVRLGRTAGLSDDEIARIPEGPDASEWAPFDAILLRAADELHTQSFISDRNWEGLSQRYDERQLIEVPMLVGNYHAVAFTLNSLGVEREDGAVPLPGRDD